MKHKKKKVKKNEEKINEIKNENNIAITSENINILNNKEDEDKNSEIKEEIKEETKEEKQEEIKKEIKEEKE